MSKYEFARRLKRMVHEECIIHELETNIARKSGKFYQLMAFLKTSLNKQELELSAYRKEINRLKHCNAILEKYIQKEEARLCATVQKAEQMQLDYQQTLTQRIEQRRETSIPADCIRSLQQSTQTYINLSALPQMVQGISLCETYSSSDWKPFCIDPLKHTQKEVQDIIWHKTQLDSVFLETWEQLILAELLQEPRVDMETESCNETIVI